MDEKYIHNLSETEFITPELKTWFQENWIETLEEAVSALAAMPVEFLGKEEFLKQAKETLGEEKFQELSTALPPHAKGLWMPTEHVPKNPSGEKEPEATQDETENDTGNNRANAEMPSANPAVTPSVETQPCETNNHNAPTEDKAQDSTTKTIHEVCKTSAADGENHDQSQQ
ncbi:MAG: hypothetical protein IKR48_06170 [Kiritimatiellae bacterium]|nr:hypothetical protein [Kiritimatiellia bacterium]